MKNHSKAILAGILVFLTLMIGGTAAADGAQPANPYAAEITESLQQEQVFPETQGGNTGLRGNGEQAGITVVSEPVYILETGEGAGYAIELTMPEWLEDKLTSWTVEAAKSNGATTYQVSNGTKENFRNPILIPAIYLSPGRWFASVELVFDEFEQTQKDIEFLVTKPETSGMPITVSLTETDGSEAGMILAGYRRYRLHVEGDERIQTLRILYQGSFIPAKNDFGFRGNSYTLENLGFEEGVHSIIVLGTTEDLLGSGTQEWAYDWNKVTWEAASRPLTVNVAAPAPCGDNVGWVYGGGTLILTGSGETDEYDGENPAPWTDYRKEIQRVLIGNGVTGIGENAFRGCGNLTSVALPETMGCIGDYAFYGCSSLTSVVLPEGLETIGTEAFAGCRLTQITGSDENRMQTWDFFYPTGLCHITLPESVSEVGFGAFFNNPLAYDEPDWRLPDNLTTIGAEAFRGTGARFAWLPESAEEILTGAFADCVGLQYIYIPYGCETIEPGAIPEETVILGTGKGDDECCNAEIYARENGNRFIMLEDPNSGDG